MPVECGSGIARSEKTDTGQDEFFQVNYLSNVTLTLLLIQQKVLELKSEGQLSRLLFISSDSHQGASYIDYDEFGRYFDYRCVKGHLPNYSYFKLVLNTYATELKRPNNVMRLHKCRFVPSLCTPTLGKRSALVVKNHPEGFPNCFSFPEKSALPVVYMALSADYEGITNEYLHMFNPKKMDPKGEAEEADKGIAPWSY